MVKLDLEVMAKLAHDESDHFDSIEDLHQNSHTKWYKLVTNLITIFSKDRHLLVTRGSLIIRQLCWTQLPKEAKVVEHSLPSLHPLWRFAARVPCSIAAPSTVTGDCRV